VSSRQTSIRLSDKTPPGWLGALAALAAVAVGALVFLPLKSVADPASLGVVFIPGVLALSTLWGLRIGLLTAALSALAFNWFYIPPTGRLDIADKHDFVAFVVFAIVAVVSGTLAELARARAAEAERRREETAGALAELEQLARERDRMQAEAIEAEALRRSDELKTALLRSVSHDLRTPLTSIIAAGAALDSPSASAEERHELSEAVVEQGQRLSRLVENLLDVSRLESGSSAATREDVDVGEVLEAARESVGAADSVSLAIDPELPMLSADAAQLERAFANLLDNAIVHGGGQPVLVRSRQVGSRLVVRVIDRGPGIPEPERRRIFEPFVRAESSQGSGLGLAIARGFIEANGGQLEVESLPGQGSSFVVSFEAAAPAAGAAA
jgi:two-component system sensor histidine kinase KdpD